MLYNIDDNVIFIGKKNKKYKHNLNKYEIYKIFDTLEHIGIPREEQDIYYGVIDKYNMVTTWFEYDDFILLKDFRRKKLKKLNKLNGK